MNLESGLDLFEVGMDLFRLGVDLLRPGVDLVHPGGDLFLLDGNLDRCGCDPVRRRVVPFRRTDPRHGFRGHRRG